MTGEPRNGLETQIDQWRSYLWGRQAIHTADVDELEGHLRDQVAELIDLGLNEDEAFLIAVKRLGSLDALSREFAREHSERLWKQLVLATNDEAQSDNTLRRELFVVLCLAVAAALAIKAPVLFGYTLDAEPEFYLRNMSLFALPFLAGYYVWKHAMRSGLVMLALPFLFAIVFANVYEFSPSGSTLVLTAIHLPIVLWLAVGFAYGSGDWRSPTKRMDFIRFSGELFIYYVLIALGGGVLTGFTLMIFAFIGIDLEPFIEQWTIPCGAMGAVLVGAWLVEAKQSVVENMAPVLTRVFTPLFAVMLLAFIVTMLWTGTGIDTDRKVLIGFDLLLVLVLALLLYAVSARDPRAAPDTFDVVQLVLVLSALAVDVLALIAILSRITEFGLTPNRVAGLGLNLILFVNLTWSAYVYTRFLRHSGSYTTLERWQTAYLPVYGAWAGFVVVGFPPLFGFV